MKGRLIALDHIGELEAAALIVDGRLEDLIIDTDAPTPGTIYRAIADRPMKGQGGMFLNTPDGHCFLRQTKGLAPGQAVLVQVTGYSEAGKAIPVTADVLFKSRFAIITPEKPGLNISRSIRDEDRREELLAIANEQMGDNDFGLILRSAAANGSDDEIAEDIRAMVDMASAVLGDLDGKEPEKLIEGDGPHTVAWREWHEPATIDTEEGSFEAHGVMDMIEDLRRPRVDLGIGNNSCLFVEPTRAFVAVDVNTGADTSMAAGLKANLAAAKAIPRALRLRGLGGMIIIDLAPMPKKERRTFETSLRAQLKADGIDTVLAGWTPLGNYELQRKRERRPLKDCLPKE